MQRGQLVEDCGMFGVKLFGKLTNEELERLHSGLNNRGYCFASSEETDKSLRRLAGNDNFIHPAHKHWVDSLIYALNLTVKARTSAIAERGLVEAVKTWGKTDSILKGGFILPDGSFLDMSGGGSERCLEHKCIERFFPSSISSSQAVCDLKDLGLIRWVSEAKGISMRVLPSAEQMITLRKLVEFKPEKFFFVDLHEPKFKAGSRIYPPGISANKIITDITLFYETGVMGAMSSAMKFHCWTTDEAPSRP